MICYLPLQPTLVIFSVPGRSSIVLLNSSVGSPIPLNTLLASGSWAVTSRGEGVAGVRAYARLRRAMSRGHAHHHIWAMCYLPLQGGLVGNLDVSLSDWCARLTAWASCTLPRRCRRLFRPICVESFSAHCVAFRVWVTVLHRVTFCLKCCRRLTESQHYRFRLVQ